MQRIVGPGTVITQDAAGTIIPNGGVVVAGEQIIAVGDFDELTAAYPEARMVYAAGGTIMPGLINAHAHFYGLFARGIALKDPPPETFRQVLERVWWRLDKALDERGVYLSAALGGIAALRAGCTTVLDHHASPNAIDGSLDLIAEAMDALGLRAALCYEVTDRDGPERAAAGIAENVRFAGAIRPGGRLAAKFGLHASFTVGPQTMAAARRAEADLGVGFHIHCGEGPEDGEDARDRYGKKLVQRLRDDGILGARTILGHCVHIDEEEIGWLAQTGTTVSHQPHSNMGNAVGWPRTLAMQVQGVKVALGTDGYNWDMLETMRTAAALHAHMARRPGAGIGEFAHSLLQGNAALASAIFGRRIGVLEPGAAADIIALDYFAPTPLTGGNLPWHIQFGLSAAQVRTVMIAGQVVMQDRQVVGLDEFELALQAGEVALETWERF